MLTAYGILGVFGLVCLSFVLWYDYWYTPRHKNKGRATQHKNL